MKRAPASPSTPVDLLAQAVRQPGVRDVMAVLNHFRRIDAAAHPPAVPIARVIASVSSSSTAPFPQ